MSSSTFSSKAVLKAYGLAAFIVVTAHLVFAYSDSLWRELYRLSIPVRDDALRFEAGIKLAAADDSVEAILLVGSSQTREDFDTAYLNGRFEGRNRFINLGVSGQGNPIEMYMLTPHMIETKPSLVVYMPYVGSIYYPNAYRAFHYYFDPNILPLIHKLYGWGEAIDHGNAIARGHLAHWSMLYRYRRSLRYMVDDAVRRWASNAPPKEPVTFGYHGRQPPSHFRRLIAKHREKPRFYEHRHTRLSQAAFLMMADSLKRGKIPLLVIDGPTNPLIRNFYDPALNAVYDEFWSEASAALGFTYVPKSDLPKFEDEDFNDFTHLNAAARARFSEFVADYLENNATKLGLGSN
jgi:hypothetical protein